MAEPGRDPGPVLGYYREDTYRIAAAVKVVEGTRRNDPKLSPRTPVINGWPIPAYTTGSGFAAGSKTSPSSATVNLAVPGAGDGLADGASVTMWNYSTAAVATPGKLVFLTHFNGRYVFLVGDC